MRPVMSGAVPAGKPTMMCTGGDGEAPARAARGKAGSAAVLAARLKNSRRGNCIKNPSNQNRAPLQTNVTSGANLLYLDIGLPDHLAPFHGFIGHELGEFGWRHRHRLSA